MSARSVPCWILRGGTSKGVFLLESDLPAPGPARDHLIKRVMGSPDPRQIDGLGGADILTSKVAIVGPSREEGADVDYTFAQVGIAQDTVSYEGNCGNISAAVGPFAIERGWVAATSPVTRVRVFNTNTRKMLVAEVPVADGVPLSEGDYVIDGVPGSGARILLDFAASVGSLGRGILPTGSVRDPLRLPEQVIAGQHYEACTLEASIVDVSSPVVFVRARDLGLRGTERPDELERIPGLMERLEWVRGAGAALLGLAGEAGEAFARTPYLPFFCMVAEPPAGVADADGLDVVSRLVGFKKVHKTFPGTGAVCLAAAARIPGTIVHELCAASRGPDGGANVGATAELFVIGHPAGRMDVEIALGHDTHNGVVPTRAAFGRTWRKILEGRVFVAEREGGDGT